jgi:non-lysosomal glucosylceramidase
VRIFREHQMCTDNAFLTKNWRNIRRAVEWLILHDANGDGLVDGSQDHTLDAAWYGEIAWISGLCLAALRAGEEMAKEAGDADFAQRCRAQFERGKRSLETKLFNGEYFFHIPDPEKGRRTLGSYNTCHIDQVFGQSWAFQVGLGRVMDREMTLSALRSLWKYNFMPDVGPYLAERQGWRPYALAGDGGMVMNTNPRNEDKPWGEEVTWQAGYFAECMSGFEHQVAAHMMAEGMVDEALTLTRCIHDRYHAARRNPFNEIECSDHYARAMASHGTFLTACGFRSHGPHGFLAFAPKIGAKDFSAAFTAAGGWGVFRQKIDENGRFLAEIDVRFGKIRLKHLSLELPGKVEDGRTPKVFLGKKKLDVRVEWLETMEVFFEMETEIRAGEALKIGF